MTLSKDSLEWAIKFVSKHSDGDIFPKVAEISAIVDKMDEFITEIEGKPLGDFAVQPCRRFIVRKDEISYRQATQLHPQDSIILSAIIYQFGQGIEQRRLGRDSVFSYRFLPTEADGLYDTKTSWNDFWVRALKQSKSCNKILSCDIADFYNQIYHHTIENQLVASGLPNQAVKWIINLLESTTAGVSRGVPIGPHAIHLIAESTLIPVDNSLQTIGLNFMRYVDDMIIFCDSQNSVENVLAKIASTLDKQQRLMLQRHKTKVYSPHEFEELCKSMIEDRPIDTTEDKLLKVINKYTKGNPYLSISYNNVSEEDWKEFSEEAVTNVIEDYLKKEVPDYIRLRWFYRRLAQVGHPGALDVSIQNISRLGPCLANICFYISSIQSIEESEWKIIGGKLLTLYDSDQIQNSEFFRLSVLSLFSRQTYINHFEQLSGKFETSDPFAQREILLSAYQNGAFDWLREQKERFAIMDPWQKMAFLFCVSGLPPDEKKCFVNRWKYYGPFENVLARWSKTL